MLTAGQVWNDLGDALDAPEFLWISGSNGIWSYFDGDADLTHDGQDVGARARSVGNNSQAWFEVTVLGPGLVEFWWKLEVPEGESIEDKRLKEKLLTASERVQ